jgi:hypothetical protein
MSTFHEKFSCFLLEVFGYMLLLLCINKKFDKFLFMKNGFQEMFKDLGELLCTITGFDSFSLQPNAGAAGEYAGLMVIRAYHLVRCTGHV